jgi:hypothetical protein
MMPELRMAIYTNQGRYYDMTCFHVVQNQVERKNAAVK